MAYQYPSSGGLPGDKFASPVLSFGHEGPLELLLVLPGSLLLLLFGIVGGQLGLSVAAGIGEHAPAPDHHEPAHEREDRREQKTPPFSFTEAFTDIIRERRGRLFLGRSHSPMARGIQSDAPCTCCMRAA